jgi:RHS repeat-associated protein
VACSGTGVYLSFNGHNVSGVLYNPQGSGWRFVHGPGTDDPLIGYHRQTTATEKILYYVTDGQGRVLALADSSGFRSSEYDNNSSIARWRLAGGAEDAHSFNAQRMAGDDVPKLSFYRNRAYDQATGRWTQEDPIGVAGGLNLYQFNGNNPVSYVDPFGLSPCDPPGSCQAKGVAIGSGIGVTLGGIVALGCTATSGGVCGLGAGAIITGFGTAGAAAGGLAGTILDNTDELGSAGTEVVNSVSSKAKEWVTAILILLGGGKTDVEVRPDPRPAAEQPHTRPKKEGDPDNPEPEEGS